MPKPEYMPMYAMYLEAGNELDISDWESLTEVSPMATWFKVTKIESVPGNNALTVVYLEGLGYPVLILNFRLVRTKWIEPTEEVRTA